MRERNYAEVAGKRREKFGADERRRVEAFEQACRIAIQIVDLRERHDLRQSQIAERCGMDQADISRIERSRLPRTPSS